MNNTKAVLVSLIVSVVVVAGAYFWLKPASFGDFPGGVTPSQVFTANLSTNSISPITALQNIYTTGGISVGGVNQYNQIAAIYNASSSVTATSTLGPFGATTSTATSSFSILANATSGFAVTGLQVGDPCSGSANTSSIYVDGCAISAVGGGNATATFAYANLTGAAYTTVTSTVFRFVLTHLPY